jgi:TolB-like protein/DNA-binding winged helix-turn-helix (wHTH) protein
LARDDALGSDGSARPRAALFGAFSLTDGNGRAVSLTNRRAQALLAMLFALGGEPLDRDHVSRLLWPGRFTAQAKASLRQCLLTLEKALSEAGIDIVDVSRRQIALKAGSATSDLAELESALAERRVDTACGVLAEIGNRPLLDAFALGEAFAKWRETLRTRIESRIAIAVDRTLAQQDDDPEARSRLGEAWQGSGRAAARRAESRKRIAVLPFEQFDAIGGDFFLDEGVVEELGVRLGAIPGIALVGRTSVAAVADDARTLPEIAKALAATHLVEGTVHRLAESVRIAIRLIEGATGTEVWSERWDGTLESAISMRQLIGSHVIAGLCEALGIDVAAGPIRRMTASREAYSLYLQGRALTFRALNPGVADKAVELLEQALALDPDFAECWTALAEAHVHVAVYTPCLERVDRSRRMAECAARPIALDPRRGHPRAMLGIHEWTEQRPCRALDMAFDAYRLEPTNADVVIRLGSFLLYIGRAREALPYLEAGVELDPVYGRNYIMLCMAHFSLGNLAEALAAGQRGVDLGMPTMWLAIVQAVMGDREKAVATYYESRLMMNTVIPPPAGTDPLPDAARDAYWGIASKGICSGDPVARATYCTMLDGLHQTMPDPHDASIIHPAIWMGHAELVMQIYREQIHPANLFALMCLWADCDPLDRTRKHPGFQRFAQDIGLVEAWEKYGWPDSFPRPASLKTPRQLSGMAD